MTDEPISTWTAALYIAAGALLLLLDGSPETRVMFGALAFLGVATGLFHADWSPVTADLDHAGMIGALLALGTGAIGGPWWLMLAAGAVSAFALVAWQDVYSHALIGVLAYFALLAVGASDLPTMLAATAVLGMGFLVHQTTDHDLGHSLWHAFSAFGLAFLWTGAI